MVTPLIAGEPPDIGSMYREDVSYLRDLGLIAPGRQLRIANPIYREAIVRALASMNGDSKRGSAHLVGQGADLVG